MPGPGEVPTPSLRERLAHHLERFTHAARRVHAAGDDEAIHDTRVAARRLGEELALGRAGLDADAVRRARRALRRLRRRLGRSREAEVDCAEFEALLPRVDAATQSAAEPLFERLRRRRERGRARAARATRAERVERIAGRVEAVLGQVGAGGIEDAESHLARREAELAGALAALGDGTDDGRLHEARLAIKKARYAGEAISAVCGDASPSPRLVALRRLQELLGGLHDRASLAASIAAQDRRDAARGAGLPAGVQAALLAALEERQQRARSELPALLAALASAAPPTPRGRPAPFDR